MVFIRCLWPLDTWCKSFVMAPRQSAAAMVRHVDLPWGRPVKSLLNTFESSCLLNSILLCFAIHPSCGHRLWAKLLSVMLWCKAKLSHLTTTRLYQSHQAWAAQIPLGQRELRLPCPPLTNQTSSGPKYVWPNYPCNWYPVHTDRGRNGG